MKSCQSLIGKAKTTQNGERGWACAEICALLEEADVQTQLDVARNSYLCTVLRIAAHMSQLC